jgi:hypothetical protein
VLCWRLRSTTVTAWSLSSSIPSASTRLHCYSLRGYGSSQVWTTLNYPGSRGETWRSGLSGHIFPRRAGTTPASPGISSRAGLVRRFQR